MRFSIMWYVRPAKPQISACAYAQSDQSLSKSLEYSMPIKLLTEQPLEFLSLKQSCTGSSESTLDKMRHCWKSHVTAHIYLTSKPNIRTRTASKTRTTSTTPSATTADTSAATTTPASKPAYTSSAVFYGLLPWQWRIQRCSGGSLEPLSAPPPRC